ncbi:MAG: thiamine pyrophosphate-dependent enzyme [Lachnospiraceae bacterium]
MNNNKTLYLNGNEAAALAASQINYHIAGYFPITPSTQVVETLDKFRKDRLHDIVLISAEGEHSAAGICYGASACGARVFNATSANGLLYSLEQLPVQSGTRMPMVLNVACRSVSAPLSIKCDHSDLMYALNTGWLILFAHNQQEVYDLNICGIRLSEALNLPLIVAYDGFFTSHQKISINVLPDDDVKSFIGTTSYKDKLLDFSNPITIGAYMNEPYLINNRYQLRIAMNDAADTIRKTFAKFRDISSRNHDLISTHKTENVNCLIFALGSSYTTLKIAVDELEKENIHAGAFTLTSIRPFPGEEIAALCSAADTIILLDRQDSYGCTGGNMSTEIKAVLYDSGCKAKIYTRIYGLGGLDFYVTDAKEIIMQCIRGSAKSFDYFGQYPGTSSDILSKPAKPISEREASPTLDSFSAMPKRIAPGHSACPGCGIMVNINILLSAIPGNVVLLFHTGCGMIVTTSYPKSSFKVPYIHNLFQNGPATMTGIVAAFKEMQRRMEYPDGDITFVMISGDGGMDIGMGSAIAAALRNDPFILFEYDNGGYMNTGYQQSYSTPKGALSSTARHPDNTALHTHYKNTPFIMAAAGASYVATAAECNVSDFRKKAKNAYKNAKCGNFSYIRALSACPLNWGDTPAYERQNIEAAVNSCYFPLYEISGSKLTLTYNPEKSKRKCPVSDWFKYMKRTKYLLKPEYADTLQNIQDEVDERFNLIKKLSGSDTIN